MLSVDSASRLQQRQNDFARRENLPVGTRTVVSCRIATSGETQRMHDLMRLWRNRGVTSAGNAFK